MITGKPISAAARSACSSLSRSPVPGRMGTPAAVIALRAEILPPIRRMISGVGPMKAMPHLRHTSAKSGFSERKP